MPSNPGLLTVFGAAGVSGGGGEVVAKGEGKGKRDITGHVLQLKGGGGDSPVKGAGKGRPSERELFWSREVERQQQHQLMMEHRQQQHQHCMAQLERELSEGRGGSSPTKGAAGSQVRSASTPAPEPADGARRQTRTGVPAHLQWAFERPSCAFKPEQQMQLQVLWQQHQFEREQALLDDAMGRARLSRPGFLFGDPARVCELQQQKAHLMQQQRLKKTSK